MDEQELAKQFKTMEGDTQVQAAYAATLPAPPVRKRITIADLKKEIDRIDDKIDDDALTWIGEIDVRLETLEKRTAKHNETLLEDVKIRIDAHETAIEAIGNLVRYHLTETAATPAEPAAEMEFAQPPQQTVDRQARAGDVGSLRRTYPPIRRAGGLATKSDIEAVARVCQTMTDVLLICRLLKAEQSIPDEDRIYLLTIACRVACVPLSPGLQIRAGVRHVEV